MTHTQERTVFDEIWDRLRQNRATAERLVNRARAKSSVPNDHADEVQIEAAKDLLTECAIDWVTAFFNTRDWVEIAAIPADGSRGCLTRTQPIHEPEGRKLLTEFVRAHIAARNLYYGLHPRKPRTSGRASGKDIAAHHAICCDLDWPIDIDQIAPQDLVELRRLVAQGHAQAICTGSGHVQAVVKLEPTDDQNLMTLRIERQKQMQCVIGSDNVADLARILRLPATINHLNPKKIAQGRQVELVVPLFGWE
jgi:hypothetical protein